MYNNLIKAIMHNFNKLLFSLFFDDREVRAEHQLQSSCFMTLKLDRNLPTQKLERMLTI